jgi:hypothetical protein
MPTSLHGVARTTSARKPCSPQPRTRIASLDFADASRSLSLRPSSDAAAVGHASIRQPNGLGRFHDNFSRSLGRPSAIFPEDRAAALAPHGFPSWRIRLRPGLRQGRRNEWHPDQVGR